MLSKEIVNIAKKYNLNITKSYIFGTINKTLIYINLSKDGLRIEINLYLFTDDQIAIIKKQINDVIQKPNSIEYKEESKILELKLVKRLRFNWSEYEIILDRILNILNNSFPSKSSNIVILSQRPIYESQANEIDKRESEKSRTIWLRSSQSLFLGLFSSFIVQAMLSNIPFLKPFVLSPIVFILSTTLASISFFKGLYKKESTFFSNCISWITILLVIQSSSVYFGCWLSIPPEFNKNHELVIYIISQFQALNLVMYGLFVLFVLASSIYGLANKFSLLQVQIIDAQQAEKYLSFFNKKTIIYVLTIFAFIFAMFYSVKLNDSDTIIGEISYMKPILFLSYIILLLTIQKAVVNYFSKLNIKVQLETFFLSGLLPIIIFMALGIIINSFSAYFDNSKPISKIGIVSQFRDPVATMAICYQVLDPLTQQILPISICNHKDQFVRPGNKVNYLYKPGLFSNGVYIGVKTYHPDTIEDLLKENSENINQIRKLDFDYINYKDKNYDFTKNLKKWDQLCRKQEAVYCRMISYAYDLQYETEKAREYLKIGCSQNDYTSCYGLIYAKAADDKTRSDHENLTFNSCELGDIVACFQYTWAWTDDKNLQRRQTYLKVLGKLCNAGDEYSCKQIPWEKHRI